ncbi:MAG: hypothetical protein ACKVQC_11095 [Elusimicrobiota bacterium]
MVYTKNDSRGRLIHALKQQQEHLAEVLEAIGRKDMSFDEVKEYLKWIHQNMKEMRKSPKFRFNKNH